VCTGSGEFVKPEVIASGHYQLSKQQHVLEQAGSNPVDFVAHGTRQNLYDHSSNSALSG
jgi:hypothetical protein